MCAKSGMYELVIKRKAKKTQPEGPRGYSRLEVWEKTATKNDDINHPKAKGRDREPIFGIVSFHGNAPPGRRTRGAYSEPRRPT